MKIIIPLLTMMVENKKVHSGNKHYLRVSNLSSSFW